MATVSHFLALINAAYVLTSTEVTRKARTSLFALGAANAGLEYLAGWAVESGKIPEDQKEVRKIEETSGTAQRRAKTN